MRRLLNTLYITGGDRYLSLDGENVVVSENRSEIARFPLHNFDSIVSCGYSGASPALIGKCAQNGIDIVFLSQSGRFLARVCGEEKGNVVLRKTQYRVSENVPESLKIATGFISGKIYNSRWVLERAARDYPLRLDADMLKAKSLQLKSAITTANGSNSADELRGIEGEAAKIYFSVFDSLILQQKDCFSFKDRSRRPPLDPVNALLSFTYTLLASNCAAALNAVGLDPYVGFFHTDRPGRMSLALDLMEELRPCLADRFVLSLINKRVVTETDFIVQDDGAVLLKDDARKKFLSAWQNRKSETIVHPYLDLRLEWGLVSYAQALLLARYLRGDIDAYPPFFWKA